MLKMTIKVIPLLALVVMLAALCGCGSEGNKNVSSNGGGSAAIADVPPETAVAEVGGEVITYKELIDYSLLSATYARKDIEKFGAEELEALRAQTLETMITNMLIRKYMDEEVGAGNMTNEAITDAESINQALRANYNLTRLVDLGEITEQIFEDYVTFARYSNWFYLHMITTVDLSDKAIGAYIEEHKDEMRRTVVSASHILLKTEEEAKAVLSRLEKGEKFEDLARELSRDEVTIEDGGRIMDFGRNEVLPEIEDAVFSMEPGELKGPVRSPRGFHVFLLHDRYYEDLPYSQVSIYVKDTLVRIACNDKIKELRQSASIVYH